MACAQQKTLYLGMDGGDMERTFTQHVFPVFEKQHNVKIVVVPGGSSDILAKAQAFRDKPQMHVMFLDDGVMQRAATMRSEEHTSELQSLMRISYAVFCL